MPVSEDNLRELIGQESDNTTFMERLVHFLFMDGEDPWPVPMLEEVKRRLASR